jgi:AcrR family transcriptional regulator
MSESAQAERRVQLSRELIVEAALRIATDEPSRSLTMARLGAELGADPTAVYRHFPSRVEMLLAAADEVYRESLDALPDADDGPLANVRALQEAIRAGFLRRPALALETLHMFSGGDGERAIVERMTAWLIEAGIPRADVYRHVQALGEAILGLTISAAGTLVLERKDLEAELRAARQLYPALVDPLSPAPLTIDAAIRDDDAVFETFLDTYLAGLRAEALRGSAGG